MRLLISVFSKMRSHWSRWWVCRWKGCGTMGVTIMRRECMKTVSLPFFGTYIEAQVFDMRVRCKVCDRIHRLQIAYGEVKRRELE